MFVNPPEKRRFFIYNFSEIFDDYTEKNQSLKSLSQKYGIPYTTLYSYARKNNWKNKKNTKKQLDDKNQADISLLIKSSEKLELLLQNAFEKVSSDDSSSDVKTIKELTSALKEAVNIKRNLFSFPDECDSRNSSGDENNEIIVTLDENTEEYSN